MNAWQIIGVVSTSVGVGVGILLAIAGTNRAQHFMPILGRLPFVPNHGWVVIDRDGNRVA